MPVVRVDDEVWEWLQSQAIPLVDTPNSVMRRVAGLEPAPNRTGTRSAQTFAPTGPIKGESLMNAANTSLKPSRRSKSGDGKSLNKLFNLGAAHALYRLDGKWFQLLTAFPGVLCDASGYLKYASEDDFRSDSLLQIGEKVNIPSGIASHPRYVRRWKIGKDGLFTALK